MDAREQTADTGGDIAATRSESIGSRPRLGATLAHLEPDVASPSHLTSPRVRRRRRRRGSSGESAVAHPSVRADDPRLVAAICRLTEAEWAARVTLGDPRMAKGAETLTLLLGRAAELANRNQLIQVVTHTLANVTTDELVQELDALYQLGEHLATFTLEQELASLVRAVHPTAHDAAVLARLGWSGRPRVTLAEAAATPGITRERMRQLERNILIRLGANERIWTPALDRALAAISEVAPIRERDAGPLLVQRGIATSPNFSVAGLVLAAETFHRALPVWDISLPIHIPLRHLFQPRAIAAELAQVSRQARVLASRQGVATIAQVHAFITSLGLAFEMVAIAPILRARPGLIWIDQDRFTAPNEAANPLALWVRKLVALQSGLSLEQIAEAIGRNPEAYAPEVDDLRAFLAWHEDFDVRDDLVFPAREFVASAILSPSEAKLVALFRRHGPILSPTDAGRLGRAEGMPAEKTYKLLHSSPLIRRLARGQYTLFYLDPDASA